MRLYLLYILFAAFSFFSMKYVPATSSAILWSVLAVLAAIVLFGLGAPLLVIKRKAGLFVGFSCLLIMLPWMGSVLMDAVQDTRNFVDFLPLLPLFGTFIAFLFILVELFDDQTAPVRVSSRLRIALVAMPMLTALVAVYLLTGIR